MAANALVQTRIDAEVKERATAVLDNIGLTVSDVMRIVLTRVARRAHCRRVLLLTLRPMTPGSEPRCKKPWTIGAPPSRMRKLKRILRSAAQLRCTKRVKVRREAGVVAIGDG
jgi:hypothetical protein